MHIIFNRLILLYIPGVLVIFTYSLIFLQTINFFFRTHVALGPAFRKNQSSQFIKQIIIDKTKFHFFVYITVLVLIIMYCFVQTIILLLVLFEILYGWVFRLQLSIITLFLAVIYFGAVTYLYFYFSGVPFKS